MLTECRDFNTAGAVIAARYASQWNELQAILEGMPLHLKASDQKGRQGAPIFDPVGTNAYIRAELARLGWQTNIPIPDDFKVFGTDVDYGREGLIAEAQFSNYPFLLNNLIRSELFLKSGSPVFGRPIEVVIIITKGRMPSSNSTLYYEQAVGQLEALERTQVFKAPIRLVGLIAEIGERIPVRWTRYTAARYSRTVDKAADLVCEIKAGRADRNQCRFRLLDV
jgi:hypothetical protein